MGCAGAKPKKPEVNTKTKSEEPQELDEVQSETPQLDNAEVDRA